MPGSRGRHGPVHKLSVFYISFLAACVGLPSSEEAFGAIFPSRNPSAPLQTTVELRLTLSSFASISTTSVSTSSMVALQREQQKEVINCLLVMPGREAKKRKDPRA